MRNTGIRYSCIIMVLVWSLYVYPETISDIHFDNYVVDRSRVLRTEELVSLNKKLELFETQTTNQIFVAIITSLDGAKLEDFSLELFNHVGIGQAIKNNGILVLISMQERQLRIAVGYGLENIITDGYASHIIREEMIPHMSKGEVYHALDAGISAMMNALLKPDIVYYFTMPWQISSFEQFLSTYPDSIQRCDAFLYLGRFYEDVWNASVLKFSKETERKKSIEYYQRYLSECPDGMWTAVVKSELTQVENKRPDRQRYLPAQ